MRNLEALMEEERVSRAETGDHSERVAEYSKIISMSIGFSAKKAELLESATLLHDVGKILIPDEIVNKEGVLTPEEYAIMKNHTKEGVKLLEDSDGNPEIIEMAKKIAMQHHEKWNGNGYFGMKGEEISKEARIVAVADVFDALSSKRCYKSKWSLEDSKRVIVDGRGEHFDPEVVDGFLRCYDTILEAMNKQ